MDGEEGTDVAFRSGERMMPCRSLGVSTQPLSLSSVNFCLAGGFM